MWEAELCNSHGRLMKHLMEGGSGLEEGYFSPSFEKNKAAAE